jgi:hypothetical protein
VDRLGDRLVAHAFVSSDRHRRLPVLHQAPGDTPRQRRIFYQPRGGGPWSAAFRSTMRSGRHRACPSAVAVHVPSDPPHRTPEPPSDLAQRLTSHQPDPDLLTLTQPEAPTWHARTSSGGRFLPHRPSWPESRNHRWNQRSLPDRMSRSDAQHLPDGRYHAGDRHLNFHPRRGNLGCPSHRVNPRHPASGGMVKRI